MKKVLNIILSAFIILNTVSVLRAESFEQIKTSVGSIIKNTVEGVVEDSEEKFLVRYIKQTLQKSLDNKEKFESLSEEQKEQIGDLFSVIYLTDFTQEEVNEISGFLTYNLSRNNTSEVLYVFTGLFLMHKDFDFLRSKFIYTLRDSKSVPFLIPYVESLDETPTLDMFISQTSDENIISVLEDKIKYLSYLGQEDYYKSLTENSIIKKQGYRNESVALRSFLEAYSYFTSKEDDSFLKGFITATLPVQHPLPGRNFHGEFINNESGRAHYLAFSIIHILIRHYILTGQDDKVYQFIEDQALRQGPYYFQFAVDALSVANAYYFSLENADERQKWWEDKQNYFIDTFYKETPFEQKLLVTSSRVSQIALEYYALGKILTFTGRNIISPVAKLAFSALPKTAQIKVITKAYLFRGYIRQGLKEYLHDKPKYLYKKVVNKLTGSKFLLPDPRAQGATKEFIEESLKRAGYSKDSEIYELFTKCLKDFNKQDENTFNYLKNLTEYIPKQDFEDFYALYNKIPSKYKGRNPFVRIVAINNKIAPEVESRVISNQGQILSNMMALLKKGGKVIQAENPGEGKVFSIVRFDNGTQIRFGAHEIDGRKIHMHFEKTILIDGMPYKLNKSFVVNTRRTMRVLTTDDMKNLWLFAQKREQDNFIKSLYRIARNENLNITEEKLLGSNMKNYAYRLNEYYFGTEKQRARAVSNLMRMTQKQTEKEAIDETLSRVLSSCYYSTSPELSDLVKKHLLNKILNRISTDMTNQEAAEILQRVLIENLGHSSTREFSPLSTTALKGSKLEQYIYTSTHGRNPSSF